MTAKGGGLYGSDYSTHWYIVRAGCISDMSVELQSLVVQAIVVPNSKLRHSVRTYLPFTSRACMGAAAGKHCKSTQDIQSMFRQHQLRPCTHPYYYDNIHSFIYTPENKKRYSN